LQGGDWAVCFLNRSSEEKTVSFDWKKENVQDKITGRQIDATNSSYKITDIWTKQEKGSTDTQLDVTIASHDVVLLMLKKL
jgi:alpha-galactosidase